MGGEVSGRSPRDVNAETQGAFFARVKPTILDPCTVDLVLPLLVKEMVSIDKSLLQVTFNLDIFSQDLVYDE